MLKNKGKKILISAGNLLAQGTTKLEALKTGEIQELDIINNSILAAVSNLKKVIDSNVEKTLGQLRGLIANWPGSDLAANVVGKNLQELATV